MDKTSKDEKSDLSAKEFVNWITFNVIPLFIFLFFLGMLIFFTVPQVNKVFEGLGKIDKIENSIKVKESTIQNLGNLEDEQVLNEELLKKMETLVPNKSTKVVEFKDTLTQIASEQGLVVTKSRAGEIIEKEEDEEVFVPGDLRPLTIIKIPTELSAVGSIEQFELFLTALYNSQDFFVVEDMEILKNGEQDLWTADFTIVKYQFDGTLLLADDLSSYASITGSAIVTEFLNRKFALGNSIITPDDQETVNNEFVLDDVEEEFQEEIEE